MALSSPESLLKIDVETGSDGLFVQNHGVSDNDDGDGDQKDGYSPA
jgi:hypothetical protein